MEQLNILDIRLKTLEDIKDKIGTPEYQYAVALYLYNLAEGEADAQQRCQD